MKLLLDTHTFFWWLNDDPMLSAAALDAISQAEDTIFVSAVTALEISIKVRIGKWPEAALLAATIEVAIANEAFQPLPISVEHAKFAGSIQGPHRDPFDRLLVAQAIIDGLTIVTIDQQISTLGASTLW